MRGICDASGFRTVIPDAPPKCEICRGTGHAVVGHDLVLGVPMVGLCWNQACADYQMVVAEDSIRRLRWAFIFGERDDDVDD